MSDFEEPKEFAFGDLNPINKPRTAKSADPGRLSILDALREVVTAHYTPDATKGTGPYKGIVLRVEEEMDQNNPAPGNWLATVFGPQGMFAKLNPLSAPKKLKRFKVRIPEIHVTLPTPKKYAQTPDEKGDHQKIINMYPTFIACDSNVEGAGPGDIVWVDYGHKENFEDPTYIGPVFPPPDSGDGGPGNGGSGPAGAFGNCGGGGGLSGSSGGSITVPNVPITDPSIKWKNAMYLSNIQTRARNSKDPMKETKLMAGFSFSEVQNYVKAGGCGRAVSGKVGLGSCAGFSKSITRQITAERIACEDQADRGYSFGGKPINPNRGGIDCSGFTHVVRSMAEFLVYPQVKNEYGGPNNGYGINNWWNDSSGNKTKQKKSWRSYSVVDRPTHWTSSSPNTNATELFQDVGDNWSWVEPTSLVKAGKSVKNSSYFKNYLHRVKSGEFGPTAATPTNYYEVEGQFHLMPGDEITLSPLKRPSWCFNKMGITHILIAFVAPDGTLRIAESGGSHGGTGSMPADAYFARCKTQGHKLWIWQRPEWSKIWDEVGGRPDQPWTPELCRELCGDEYFSAPNLAKAATENATATEKPKEDGTNTEKTEEAPGPKIEPAITVQNITKEQALAATESQEEKDEITALPEDATSSQFAETAGGKKAIAKSLEEAKANKSTDAKDSDAAKKANPSPAPVPVATCGGGSYTPGKPFTIGADRAGTPIGDVPFIGVLGEIRTNPKMKVVKSPDFDIVKSPRGENWYAKNPRVREDVAINIAEVRNIVKELGGTISSSGARRSLSTPVKKGASATSFHYTTLALDLLLPHTARDPSKDMFIAEFDPENNKHFILWVKTSKTSGSVERKGVTFQIEHKTLNAIKESSSGPQIIPTTGYFVNLTKIMRAYGLAGIGAVGKSWYKNCDGASEIWHYDFRMNAGLTVGSTTFGMQLETMYNPSSHPPWAYAGRIWRGGYFGK